MKYMVLLPAFQLQLFTADKQLVTADKRQAVLHARSQCDVPLRSITVMHANCGTKHVGCDAVERHVLASPAPCTRSLQVVW